MISSYEAAVLHMEKARSKAKGRPMKGAGWRLHIDYREYVVTLQDHEIGRFLPNNTFVFTTTGERAYPVAMILSGTMHRNLPFYWQRVDHKKYRVEHRGEAIGNGYGYVHLTSESPQLYNGLTFDLYTGRCLNPLPDAKRRADPDRRKEWLAASRAWKRKLKVIARLGVLDPLIADEKKNPTSWRDKPKWGQDQWLDILYKAIKDGDCNTDLIRMFVATEVTPWNSCTSMQMYDRIDRVIKSQSVALRTRFGVFEEGTDDKFHI